MTTAASSPGSSAPSPFQLSIVGRQAVDMFNSLDGMPVTFQPTGGDSPQVELKGGGQSRVLSTWLTRSRTGFLSLPKEMSDVFVLRIVTSGAMVRRHRFSEHVGRSGYALLVPFESMRNEEATPDFAAMSATITRASLMRCHAALHGEAAGPLPQLEMLAEINRAAMVALTETLKGLEARLQTSVGDADIFLPLLEEVLVYQLLSAWPQKQPRPRAARPAARLVRMAADYMDANLGRRLTLGDVSQATGMSVRSLQTAFREATGRTPVQFIMERRLERVRADLCQPGPQVPIRSVAERWGFSHMGEFGRRYRLRYGESPRDTQQATRS